MWSAAFNPNRRLMEIHFTQSVDRAQAEACAGRVEVLLADAAPGFCLFNNLSGLEQMDLACEPVIARLMDALVRKGVRKVVRVIPDPKKDIGFGIMTLFHYGKGIRVITCATVEEAQPHLS